MNKTTSVLACKISMSILMILHFLPVVRGQQKDPPKSGRDAADVTVKNDQIVILGQPHTGITTLYSRDPLTQIFCFQSDKYGGVIQDNRLKASCSDIDFDQLNQAGLTVAIKG